LPKAKPIRVPISPAKPKPAPVPMIHQILPDEKPTPAPVPVVAEAVAPVIPASVPVIAPANTRASRRFTAKQEEMQFESANRGRFEKTHETMYRGENLDQPTFRRRGLKIKV
jgi:cell division protein FtsZ